MKNKQSRFVFSILRSFRAALTSNKPRSGQRLHMTCKQRSAAIAGGFHSALRVTLVFLEWQKELNYRAIMAVALGASDF
jgi:hypothetical protein